MRNEALAVRRSVPSRQPAQWPSPSRISRPDASGADHRLQSGQVRPRRQAAQQLSRFRFGGRCHRQHTVGGASRLSAARWPYTYAKLHVRCFAHRPTKVSRGVMRLFVDYAPLLSALLIGAENLPFRGETVHAAHRMRHVMRSRN